MKRFLNILPVLTALWTCSDSSGTSAEDSGSERSGAGVTEVVYGEESGDGGFVPYAMEEAEAAEFLDLASAMLMLEDDIDPMVLILVDKSHALPEGYEPEDLRVLDEFPSLTLSRSGLSLRMPAVESLLEMNRAAESQGIRLRVSSTYRSYEYQKGLFQRYADSDGLEAAERYSARAGTSQHQLGTAVDFGSITNAFASSEAGLWMAENAGDYGWSLSYPRDGEEETGYIWESWHWRWIGRDAVRMQKRFFDNSQQAMLEFWDERSGDLRRTRNG